MLVSGKSDAFGNEGTSDWAEVKGDCGDGWKERAREWEGERARKSWKMAALSARTWKTELQTTRRKPDVQEIK